MSSSTSANSLPAGYSTPFTVVTENDHSAWIIIATALGLTCALIFTIARMVVRHSVTSGLGQDDWFLAGAVALAIVQSSVVLYGCSVGLGASMLHLLRPEQTRIEKTYYSSNLLCIIALGLAKISIASMLRRIRAFDSSEVIFNVTAGFIGAWTLASFLALALQCGLSHPWITLNEHCTGTFLRWKVIGAFDICTELLLLASAIYLVWAVQTSLSRKAIVVVGFACRLPIIIAIAFRLATYDQAGLTENPSLREAMFMAWTQTELNYSLISATIPGLLQFMRNLNTHFGGLTEQENMTYGSHKYSKGSFPMSILRSGNKSHGSQHGSQTRDEDDNAIRKFEAFGPMANPPGLVSKDSTSIGSTDSQRLIIQKSVSYSVEHQ